MNDVKKLCLSCHHFRLLDVNHGICRVDKPLADYPVKFNEDSCPKWRDAGQQYFIRLGWIKGKEQEGQLQ